MGHGSNKQRKALHQMSLESDTYVYFQSEIEPSFRAKKSCWQIETKISKLQNTKAMADVIDFVSS